MPKRLWIAVAMMIALGAFLGAAPHRADAATGDNLRQFDAAVPACGVGTGLAFDGTRIYLSCWGSNVLERVDPADGSSLGAITISGATDLGAMAYDGGRDAIWACEDGSSVVMIDLGSLTASGSFSTTGCVDGLAYDGVDDTIWVSCDVCTTVYHYSISGTLINSFPLGSLLGGTGNSGIAVGGDTIYLANNGASQIYQCDKAITSCTLMSTFERRLEDLECDDVTSPGKNAIWSQDAYDRTLNAWEIPAGTCGIGGGASQGDVSPEPEEDDTDCLPGIPGLPCGSQSGGGDPGDYQPVATPEGGATPVVPTTEPPTVAPPPPAATPAPSGGRAGTITAPDTGTGDGTGGGSMGAWLLAVMVIAATGGSAVLVGRRIRR